MPNYGVCGAVEITGSRLSNYGVHRAKDGKKMNKNGGCDGGFVELKARP